MAQRILFFITALFSTGLAVEGDALKTELQTIIREAGFDCDEINQVLATAFNDALSVSCDDTHR